ncbi:MAG: PAS domain S-box protein [Gammaproteobacteria bacterium]
MSSWPLRVTVAYVLAGALWIVGSDSLAVWLFGDLATLATAQTVKGLAYIALSGALVYWLAHLAVRSVTSAFERRELMVLRALHERVLDAVGHPVLALEPGSGRIASANKATDALLGHAPERLVGESVRALFASAAEHVAFEQARAGAVPDGDSVTLRATLRHRNGSTVIADVIIKRATRADPSDAPLDVVVMRDVTAQVESVRRLAAEERRYRNLFEHNPVPMWIYRVDDLRFLAVNDAAVAEYGYSRDEFLAMTIADIRPPEDVARLREEIDGLGPGLRKPAVWRHLTRDGAGKLVRISSHTTEMNGHAARLVAAWDVTEQARSEAALRESEQRFRRLTQATLDAAWDWDIATDAMWWGEGLGTVFGYTAEATHGSIAFWREHLHPDDRARVLANLDALLASDAHDWEQRYRFRRSDGSYALVVGRGYLIRDEQGRPQRMFGGINDVTEQTRMAERLQEAERMEAVGRLTGGVAHDFNNLLTVILANARLLARRPDERARVLQSSELIATAARRGADLTRSLLAFARRQPLEPENIDVAELLADFATLLGRTLGEHITIDVSCAGDLWPALADPGQLESSLLNLCFNARDAMPGGGTLTVRAGNRNIDAAQAAGEPGLEAGEYVELVVTDTGCGIAPEVLGRVFEPFFTTKTASKGTGLGLASVYGFARQSGGHVAIDSNPGRGTCVRLLLPRGRRDAHTASAPLALATDAAAPSRRTILVVEDDPLVRECAVEQLRALGYRVFEAGDGPDALVQLDAHPEVELLFTDIIMPGGMNGRELAAAARAERPALRVVYTSGYTDSVLTAPRDSADDIMLLGKPYEPDELAALVARAFETSASRADASRS